MPRKPSLPAVFKSQDVEKIYGSLCEALAKAGVVSELDLLSLNILAETYVLYTQVKDQWVKEGSQVVESYESRGDLITRPNPLYKEMIALQKELMVLMRDFRLTPGSRQVLGDALGLSVAASAKKDKDETIDDFLDV